MIPSCFKVNCENASSFSCECESKTFFCKDHMSEHLVSDGLHEPNLILLNLEDETKKEAKEKIASLIQLNNEFRSILNRSIRNTLDSIIQFTSELMNELLKVNMNLKRVSMGLNISNSILAHDLNSINQASTIEVEHFEELLQETTDDFIISLENNIVPWLNPGSDSEDNGLDIIQELSNLRGRNSMRTNNQRFRGGRGSRRPRRPNLRGGRVE